jgi:hypothetical protein
MPVLSHKLGYDFRWSHSAPYFDFHDQKRPAEQQKPQETEQLPIGYHETAINRPVRLIADINFIPIADAIGGRWGIFVIPIGGIDIARRTMHQTMAIMIGHKTPADVKQKIFVGRIDADYPWRSGIGKLIAGPIGAEPEDGDDDATADEKCCLPSSKALHIYILRQKPKD